MPIPMWLINTLKSGEASIFTGEMKNLHLRVKNRKIDLNFLDRELLKDMLKIAEAREESLMKKLIALKSTAERLKKDGFTMTISCKGSLLLTLGSEANPTLSQAVTGTDAIEVNSWKQLIQVLTEGIRH